MTCLVNRSPQGKITSVESSKGKRSALFDKIHSNIFMLDGEASLSVYKNAVSDKVKERFGEAEPELYYKSNGNQYDNLEELIINEPMGTIQMGFVDGNEFMAVAQLTVTPGGRTEYLYNMVSQGFLSADRKVMPDGTVRFQGKGEYTDARVLNSVFAFNEAKMNLGEGRIETFDDGTIEIQFNQELTIARDKQGNQKVVLIDDIPTHLDRNPDTDNKVDLAYEHMAKRGGARPLTRKSSVKNRSTTAEIEKRLTQFLKSVGFSVTSLDSYRERYRTKFGKNPDIEALSDIANRVVAIKKGADPVDNLSEELAHIAIELYNDQSSIAVALASIHKTSEYAEFAEYYRQLYSTKFDGVELEEQVRKEVLGKVLKKQIINKFSTEGKTADEASLINNLRDIWAKVVRFVTGKIKPSHERVLDKLNKDISESILANEVEQFQTDITDSEAFFYNAMPSQFKKAHNDLKVAKRVIEDLHKKVLKQDAPNQSEVQALEDALNENEVVAAFNTIVGVTTSQVATVEAGINHAITTGELISQKDINVAHVLDEALVPMLNKIRNTIEKAEIEKPANKQRLKRLSENTDEINKRIAAIKPELTKDNERYVEKATKDVVDRYNLTAKQEEEFRGHIEGNINDTSLMGKLFGLASHSRNPLIQMMHQKVVMISQKVRRQFKDRLNKEVTEIDNKGLMKYQNDIIRKGTFFYKSPIRWDLYKRDLDNQENKIISDLTGKSIDQVASLKKKQTPREIINDEKVFTEFKDRLKDWRNVEGIERRNTDAHYAERERRYAKANVSKVTEDYLNRKNSNVFAITRKYQKADGTIDKLAMSSADKASIAAARELHAAAKSPYDSSGNLKVGLDRVSVADMTQEQRDALPFPLDSDYTGEVTVLEQGTTLEELHPESRKALDMFHLDMLYRSELKSKSKSNKPLESFIKQLEELEKNDPAQAYEWAVSNGTIGLTSEFYEGLGQGVSFINVAEDYIEGLEEPARSRKFEVLEDYKRLQSIKKDLLKRNRSQESFIETDAFHMTLQTKGRLRELEQEISNKKRALNLPFELQEKIIAQDGSESALTSDFDKMLTMSGETAYDFALKHMTEDNFLRVKTFARKLEGIIDGSSTYVKPEYNDFLEEIQGSKAMSEALSGVTNKEERQRIAAQVAKDEYAKRYVASYFKRFQPVGYTEAINDLKSGKIKISEFVNNREEVALQNPGLEFVELTPDYTWSEDINNGQYINRNFKEGLPFVPKLSKYLDKGFFEEFGINPEEYLKLEKDDLSLLTATKNKGQFELLQRMVRLREESAELQGDAGKVNKYQRPQVSKSVFEKYSKLSTGNLKNAKDTFTDLFQSKVDEKEYGETFGATHASDVDVKIIPKYFQQELEDPALVTDNVLQAAMLDYEAALRYKERTSAERELKAYEDKILNQSLIDAGGSSKRSKIFKRGQTSNYYQKAQEMNDHFLYGIRQNRKIKTEILGRGVDLTQVFNKVTKYAQFTNLAFNPIVDATSYTTGVYNNVLDRIAGDFYSSKANAAATRELPSLVAKYLSESGKLNKNSKLGHMLEFYGLVHAGDRLEESSRNRFTRALSKSAFGLSKLANMPVTPKIMLAILHDMKYVDGQFQSYNNFKKNRKAADSSMSEQEIKSEWNNNTDTMYSNIVVDPNKGVIPGKAFADKYPENTQEKFDEISGQIAAKIGQVAQSVDSLTTEEDQTAAQRDAAINAFLMHRSWFLINMTRKFKGKHFNIATGQIDEGHYRSAYRRTSKLVKGLRQGRKLSEIREEFEEHERRNARRFRADMVGISILTAVTLALLASDDDDDTVIEDFAQLIALRTTSEAESANFIGMYGTVEELYESPLIQLKVGEKLYQAATRKDKKMEYLLKATPLKRQYQLGRLQEQVSSFRHFNQGTLLFIDDEK